MLLYHGTSEKRANKILKEGFKPRGKKKGNWGHTVESAENAIYLTDSAFALHFSGAATTKPTDGRQVIIEIDTDYLLPSQLVADEDAAAQTFTVPGMERATLNEKSEFFKKMLVELAVHHNFGYQESLDALGTCAVLGEIPIHAIKRAIFINSKASYLLMMNGVDPTITKINRLILGERYKKMIKVMFKDEQPEIIDMHDMDARMDLMQRMAVGFDAETWKLIDEGIKVQNV